MSAPPSLPSGKVPGVAFPKHVPCRGAKDDLKPMEFKVEGRNRENAPDPVIVTKAHAPRAADRQGGLWITNAKPTRCTVVST
jgi:hypothetical protein